VAWVHRNIDDYGGDPDRIFVAGHSAGGQMVGMLALTDWHGEYGLPPGLVKGAVALSGLFDLEVFRYSWLAPKLLLSAETVRRQSPILNLRSSPVELLVALGADESPAFHEQSKSFADAWLAAGNTGRHLSIPGHTHLSVYATYADPASALTIATVELTKRQT
jgi:arylformamidase